MFAQAQRARIPRENDLAALRREFRGRDFDEGPGVEFRERETREDGGIMTGAQRAERLRKAFTFERDPEAHSRARRHLPEMGGELAGAGLGGDWKFGNRAQEIGMALPRTKQCPRHEKRILDGAERVDTKPGGDAVGAGDAKIERQLPQPFHDVLRGKICQAERETGETGMQRGETRNEEPLHETVPGADGERHGFVGASLGEIHEGAELLPHGPREPFSGGAHDDLTSAAPEEFDSEVVLQFADLPAVLALPHRIAADRARDASGIRHGNEGAEPVERQPALGKERLKHDSGVRTLSFFCNAIARESGQSHLLDRGSFNPPINQEPQTMKLTKALKLKNQLAGEVTELKERLTKQNSRAAKIPFDYDAQEILAALRAKVEHLIAVKSVIAAANVAQYPRIFRLAELKGIVALFKALDVRHGVFKEAGNYAQPAYEVEYVAQLKKSVVDGLVAELEAEISALQDGLDEFNHTQAVELTA